MAYIPWVQSNKGSQGRTQGRNPEEGTEVEAVEDAASCLAPHGWLNLAFSDTQDYLPKGGATHHGLARPSSINVEEKCLPGLLAYRTTWEGHFLSSGFLFSDNSSSGHIDNYPTQAGVPKLRDNLLSLSPFPNLTRRLPYYSTHY